MKILSKIKKKHFTFVRYSFIMGLYSGVKGADSLGEVIAVLSGKGGTGKTSVCAGLAQALAEAGNTVLCIDCDIGLRNLDISLGLTGLGALSFMDVLQEDFSLSQASSHPDFPTLRFLTAPVNLSADQVDPEAFGGLLHAARDSFQYILLDAPAGIEAGFRLAAGSADRILLVTGPDPGAIRDAGRAGEALELMGKTQVRLIVNRISTKLASAMALTVDDIMDRAGLPLLGLVPEDSHVTMAAVFGKPLLKYTRRGAAAACRRIARRLMGRQVKVKL